MKFLTKQYLKELQTVTNPELAPNEQQALFLRTVINKEENTYNTNLFHIHLETNEISQWTFGNEKVASPKWSPNGEQVAFLAKHGEKQQLCLLNVSGGEIQALTDFPTDVQSFLWSPCSEKILLTRRNAEQNCATQIAILTIATKESEVFTSGNYSHTLWDISNDGQQLVISVNHQDDDTHTQLYLVDIVTKQESLIVEAAGNYGQAVFSYDDCYIAYTGNDLTYKNATHTQLYIYDIQRAVTQNLTADLDAPVGDMAITDVQRYVETKPVVWTVTNDLYFQLSTMGDVRLYYATLEGAIYPASPEEEHIYSYTIFKSGNCALATISNPTEPGELFYLDITTGERQQLTSFNEVFLQELALVQPEPIVFETFNGQMVYGWVMKPAQFLEGERYPVIIEAPCDSYGMYASTFYSDFQLVAAQGYGVIYINSHGSHGYSQAFANASSDNQDSMAALAYVRTKYAWIDPTASSNREAYDDI